jgi:hypothetical protein
VIISAAVATKSGKALFSRQYSEMSRVRIEGLLTAFPKLIDSHSQHTFVETDSVRYVYLPLEKLYLMLITNKSSNIIEDLDTLHSLSQIVKEKCPTMDEKEASEKAFELIFAFDEVISMGYRDNLTIDQINTLLEMDSHEENLQKLIYQNKLEDAISHSKSEEARIKKMKKDNPSGSGKMKGIGSKDLGGGSGSSMQSSVGNTFNSFEREKVGSFKSESTYSRSESTNSVSDAPQKKIISSSLKLGMSKKKESSLLENLVQQGEVARDEPTVESVVEQPRVQIQTENVHIRMEEEVVAELNRQGAISTLSVEGSLFLTVKEKESAMIRVFLANEGKKGFTPKTHPNIDKNLFAEKNILAIKTPNRPFPVGNNALKVLQWTCNGEKVLPLSVTCWPSTATKGMNCTVEYDLLSKNMTLEHVEIILQVPSNDVKVEDVENGTWNVKNNTLTWILDVIDSKNENGVLEFSVPNGDENSFFPITIKFSSSACISGISVEDVLNTKDDSKCLFSSEVVLNGTVSIQ